MKSTEYIDFIVKQIGKEKVERILMVGLMNLKALIAYYLPAENVAEAKRVLFDTILDLIF